MNKDFMIKWVAALRSGEYVQTTGHLRTNEGFCCLGVACDIVNPLGWELMDYEFDCVDWRHRMLDFTSAIDLSPEIRDATGIRCAEGQFPRDNIKYPSSIPSSHREAYSLSELNDKGCSFHQIADFIELNWEKL